VAEHDYPSLEEMIALAHERGANTLLFLVGNPPVIRVGRELQPPLHPRPLTFHDTQALIERLLTPREINFMNEHGNVETRFQVAGVEGTLTVFFGQGAHNLVFHLKSGAPPDAREP